MKTWKMSIPIIMGFLLLAATLITSWQVMAEPVATDDSDFISSFPTSIANGNPQNLIIESVGPPASLWFTMPQADAIGNLIITSAVDYQVISYTLSANSQPYDLVYDASAGLVWFTEKSGNQIGSIDVSSKAINEIPIPSGNEPMGIDVAPNGDVWFTQRAGSKVTRYTGSFTDFDYAAAQPEQIAVLNNDRLWFTTPGEDKIVRLTPSESKFTTVPIQLIPGGDTFAPGGITLDSSEPWISAPSMGLVGRYAPGTLSFWRWYEVSGTSSMPTAVTYRADGSNNQLWYVDTNAGQAGRIVTDINGSQLSILQQPLPGTGSQPTDIVVDNNGTAWIAAYGSNSIVQWRSPYAHFTYLPLVIKQ